MLLFTVVALPLFYGIPKSIIEYSRRRISIKPVFLYLATFLFGYAVFLIAFILLSYFPSAFDTVSQGAGFNIGSMIGFWLLALRAIFSRSARQAMRADYDAFVRPHLRHPSNPGDQADAGLDPELVTKAAAGNVEAQDELGSMYAYGEGVASDYAEAVKWFHKAAEQGYARAQFNLGLMLHGAGSVVQAVKWWRKAAEQGNANAQGSLGLMYYNGNGVPQNYVEAVKWYRKAAEQGDAEAQYSLGVMYASGKGVAEDDTEAVRWFHKAAEQGYARAQFNLGLMYRKGRGVGEDDAEAVKWYRKAAEEGDEKAQFELGMMYGIGEGVPQDYAEAVKWLRLAADHGHADAQSNLGGMYYNGHGVDQSDVLAHMWWKLAEAQGHEKARKSLSFLVKLMTKEQIAEAQRMAREWQEKHSSSTAD
jgi:TPR repeat protein